MKRIYGIIWGHCTPRIQSLLKDNKDYNIKLKTFDSLWLMKETKKITASINIVD